MKRQNANNILLLIKKDVRLAMHPTVPLMLLCSAMVFIPGYPYLVIYFYMSMGIFFTCLLGRENHDMEFSVRLPINRRDVVTSRLAFSAGVELLGILLTALFSFASSVLIPDRINPAETDAGIALTGWGFILFGVFDLIFFPLYFGSPRRVGMPFLLSGAAMFALTITDIILTYTWHPFADIIDTPDPQSIGGKLCFISAGATFFVLSFIVSRYASIKRFDTIDL